MLDAEEALGISPDEISAEQGFLDENGDFVTRAEVAQRSGMPPRTFAASEDLTPEGRVNPIPREPPNVVPFKPKITPRGLGEAGKIGVTRVFHGTRAKGFDKPTVGSSGVHVGTPSQAADFAMTKTGGRVIPLWAKVGKELPMRDLGAWSPNPLITEAERAGGLTSQMAEELRSFTKTLESNRSRLSPDAYWEQRQQLTQLVLDKLREQGYDAISYINRAEGDVPTESMIILDPEGNLVNALERPNPEEAFPEAKDMPVHELQDVEPDPKLVAETARLLHEEWSTFSNKPAPSIEELTSSLLGMGKTQAAEAGIPNFMEKNLAQLKEAAKPFFPEEEGVPGPLKGMSPLDNIPAEMLVGLKAGYDIEDLVSGETIIEKGELITPAAAADIAKSLSQTAIDDIYDTAEFPDDYQPPEIPKQTGLAPEDIIGKPLGEDIIDPDTGEILFTKGTVVTEDVYRELSRMPGNWSTKGAGTLPMLGGLTVGSGGALALMLKLQQMRQKNK